MDLTAKPLSSMEARDPYSVRFAAGEWDAITTAARARGLTPRAFARDLCLMGLMIVSSPVLMEGHLQTLAVLRAGSTPVSPNGHAAKDLNGAAR